MQKYTAYALTLLLASGALRTEEYTISGTVSITENNNSESWTGVESTATETTIDSTDDAESQMVAPEEPKTIKEWLWANKEKVAIGGLLVALCIYKLCAGGPSSFFKEDAVIEGTIPTNDGSLTPPVNHVTNTDIHSVTPNASTETPAVIPTPASETQSAPTDVFTTLNTTLHNWWNYMAEKMQPAVGKGQDLKAYWGRTTQEVLDESQKVVEIQQKRI